MNDLKLYFVVFSKHEPDKQSYTAYAGYIFAKDENRAAQLMRETYGKLTIIKSVNEINVKEGTILYGERWHTIID